MFAGDGVGTKSYLLTRGEKIDARDSEFANPVELALADFQVAKRFKLLEDGRSIFELRMGYISCSKVSQNITIERCNQSPDVHIAEWRSKVIIK